MNDQLTILTGDALERLRELPDESVQMCVTSPPYWALRDYGTATWEGGENECDHLQNRGIQGESGQRADRTHTQRIPYKEACGKCGALRVDKQLGLEKTPEEYVAKIVAVFREVRRVLKQDGTCWINLGDSYTDSGRGSDTGSTLQGSRQNQIESRKVRVRETSLCGLRPKNMVGTPWMVAFALRADGWYLRSDIIWHKPNPMPESVTDRPTKAHEYLFLLSKSERYYYDYEAIKEKVTGGSHARGNGVNPKAKYKTPDGWDTGKGSHGAIHRNGREAGATGYKHKRWSKQNESFSGAVTELVDNRNKRTVWTVPTFPFTGAHYATFPPDLIKPCILAGSKPGDTVLDCFMGSGTTAMVSIEFGRKALGIELNPESVELIYERCNVTPGLGL